MQLIKMSLNVGIVNGNVFSSRERTKRLTMNRLFRIALRSQNHAQYGNVAFFNGRHRLIIDVGIDQLNQIRFQSWQDNLGFWIAQPHVIFNDFRASLRQHQTNVDDAMVVVACLVQPADGWFNDIIDHALTLGIAKLWQRTVGTHTTRVGTLIAIVGPLVILRHWQNPVLIVLNYDKHGVFRSHQTFFQDQFFFAQLKHFRNRVLGFWSRLRNHDSLAALQTIGFDDYGTGKVV